MHVQISLKTCNNLVLGTSWHRETLGLIFKIYPSTAHNDFFLVYDLLLFRSGMGNLRPAGQMRSSDNFYPAHRQIFTEPVYTAIQPCFIVYNKI